MTAPELLHITLALIRDADLPTEEKLAVLETASTLIREAAERDAAVAKSAARYQITDAADE